MDKVDPIKICLSFYLNSLSIQEWILSMNVPQVCVPQYCQGAFIVGCLMVIPQP
jgi:hypothetical protein